MLMLLVQGSHLEYHFDMEATLGGVPREGLSEEVVFELWRHPRGRMKSWPRQRDQQPWSCHI